MAKKRKTRMGTHGDVTIRLTPEERAVIEKAAELQHLPVSTWLRQLALKEWAVLQEQEERRQKGRDLKAWLLEELWKLPPAREHADEVARARKRDWSRR